MAEHVIRRALMVAATGVVLLAAAPVQAKEKLDGEAQLAKLLDGRVAEKPVDCISLFTGNENTTVIDKTAIVYGWGSVIYVNRPDNVSSLNSNDILISHPTTDQNCSLDVIQLRDRDTHTYDGFVALRQFVPYRRVAKPQS